MTIKKARLLKVKDGFGLDLTIESKDKAGAVMNGQDKYHGLIHPDLRKAFDRLKVHLALISGFVPISEVPDIANPNMELFEKFHIHGYSVGGDDGEGTQGITLSGHMITYRGKAQNYHTPFELFDTAPEARYIYMDDLQAALLDLDTENQAYLGGKRGEPSKKEPEDKNQIDMFASKAQIAEPLNAGGAALVDGIPPADSDAMRRVKSDDKNGTKAVPKTGGRGKKQTADNPGGK